MALSAYWFSLNFQGSALLTIVIPSALDRFSVHGHALLLARLAVLGSVIAMALPPIAGTLSDRIRQRGGQRRPLLLWGTAVNVLGLIVISSAGDLVILTGGFLASVLGQSAAGSAYQAMMPDLVPPDQWGMASGYMGAASLFGTMAGLGVAGIFPLRDVYFAMALVSALGAVYTVASIREEPWTRPSVPKAQIRSHRDFRLVFAARFAVMFGQTLLMTFVLYFFEDVLHVASPAGSTALIAGLGLVGAVASTLVLGSVSDRSDRPSIVFFASIPMAAAAGGFGLYPNPHWIFLFALLYGVGYGAYLSVDWALALDAIPDLRNVARDLGIWGIASNLPAVLAPAAGGLILARVLPAATGYRVLFLVAGGVTLLGALVVLWVRPRRRASTSETLLRLLVAAILFAYVSTVYAVVVFGRLPRRRGATLVVGNHGHELEGMVLPQRLYWMGPLRSPVYSVASERVFEPGFLATRAPRPLRRLLRSVCVGGILHRLGVRPIENMPRHRPFVGMAWAVERAHGGQLRLSEVFTQDALRGLLPDSAPRDLRLRDVHTARLARCAEVLLPFSALLEPYRQEMRRSVRQGIEAQLADLQELLRGGGTLYLTPEGRISDDGSLARMRLALDILSPDAERVYLAATSYDPFRPGRLRMLVRIEPLAEGGDLRLRLLAIRPVTVSQLLATVLLAQETPKSVERVVTEVVQAVGLLPPGANLCPRLRDDPAGSARTAVQAMLRRGLSRIEDGCVILSERRRDPRFGNVLDIVAHQAAHFGETTAAFRGLAAHKTESLQV